MTYSSEVSKLVAEGSKLYASKEYDQASGKYADACELFSKENGQEDADLLLLYGKALFQNAVTNSEVFGATKAEEKEDKEEEEEGGNFQFHDVAEEGDGEEQDDEDEDEGPAPAEEEEEGGGEENEADGEPESQNDFEIAWEILDLTRSILEDKIDALKEEDFTEPETPYLSSEKDEPTDEFIILTKKLCEVYDLLGEVSLESENFPQSAIDLENCLNLRLKLYPKNSSLISESHYKLSLALEFCVEDPKLREKATEQMKLAIDSIKARNAQETDDKKVKDNTDLLKDLLVRYHELEKDPAEELKLQQMDIIKGILGEATQSEAAQPSPRPTAVNDLSSVVKKRKAKPAPKDTKKPKVDQ